MPGFRIGASYYPPHHAPDDWAVDLDHMRNAGLGLLRSAELIASWDAIEAAPGEADFSWLDELFSLAADRGIGIVLGTGTATPPLWLLDAFPDLPIVSVDGIPHETGGTWSWACRHHPGFLKAAQRWIEELASRYGSHPALEAWQLDNEIGFPFVAPHGVRTRRYCYCTHSETAFRAWLARRYESPEALSSAWAWTPTNHRYRSFDQVRAPRATPEEWGGVTAWLDWSRFLAETMAAHLAWQRRLLTGLTPTTPVTTNVFIWSRHDPFGTWMGQDPWRLAREVDALGFDYYPGLEGRARREPGYGSMFFDYAASATRWARTRLWVSELESGPIGGWAYGPDTATSPDDLRRACTEAVGAGADTVLFQGWREWDCLPLRWGALVDLDGRPTPRLEVASAFATLERRFPDLIGATEPVAPEVLLLHDASNAAALAGMGQGERLLAELAATHAALVRAGITTGFVSPDEGGALLGSGARLVVLAGAVLVSATLARDLERFVRAGGHLLCLGNTAMLDERGWYHHQRPGGGLADVLGAEEHGVEAADEAVRVRVPAHPDLHGWPGGVIEGRWQWQGLLPAGPVATSAAALGHFVAPARAAGRIGFTRARRGTGAAMALGVHPTREEQTGFAGLLRAIAIGAGVTPLFAVEARDPDRALPAVSARLRRRGEEGLLGISSEEDEALLVRIAEPWRHALDLLDGTTWTAGVGVPLVLLLPPGGSRLVRLRA